MVFILIAPSLAIGCEWVFSLTAMWVHPHQACLPTLADATWNLMLLANEGPNWQYAYVQMNDAMANVPLPSEVHIGIMTDGIPSTNACSCLDQLQVWKLLQCGGQVVCPEVLNGDLKALLFDFEELLLWNVATANEPTWDPPLIEMDLNSIESEAPPSTSAEDPLGLKGTDLAIHDLMATSLQASLHVVMPENIPRIIQVSHSSSPPTMLLSPEAASISPSPQSQTPSRADPADLTEEVLWLQGEMNVSLEGLHMTKATMDSHWRDQALSANIARCKNEAQATEALKEAEVSYAAMIKEAEAHWEIHACALKNPTRKAY